MGNIYSTVNTKEKNSGKQTDFDITRSKLSISNKA
jgi:hypothetical protein